MSNRLIQENSPYLLQHADNPVDWYAWGDEALEKAHQQDKPIFLSIGYAACHWCHVMAHESFEDHKIAAFLNEHFVSIKVDREERPDLDSIYMEAVVAMTGQGGWPLSVFLTPDGRPFFGGTYFPPVRRYSMPSFQEVLASVNHTWQQDREQILNSSQQISDHLASTGILRGDDNTLNPDVLEKAASSIAQAYDWKYGGWGSAPKFPQPLAIEFLLCKASRGDDFALEVATHNLRAMARGGMYDVIGGGFARYSTDNNWLVPHFEKMLYDNALLAKVYLHAYLLSGDSFFRQVCEETISFIKRELTHPQGGFFSSIDADSEGVEGKYYVWNIEEVKSVLPEVDSQLFIAAYGVSGSGNFEGANVLQRVLSDESLAEDFRLPVVEVSKTLVRARERLFEIRRQRVYPGVDDKVLVSWNALVLVVFSEVARYLEDDGCLDMAIRNGKFLLNELYQNGRLLRSWRAGRAQHNAYLEDYAGLILGLLSLYQSDPHNYWYEAMSMLVEEMLTQFSDPSGGFFDTRHDHENLLKRPKDLQDNATPSGNALAVTALLYYAALTGRIELHSQAENMLASLQGAFTRYPMAFGQWLCAADLSLNDIQEIAILGNQDDPSTSSLLASVWSRYRPQVVVACSALPISTNAPPLLANRPLQNNRPTAYVCQNFVCQHPVNTPEELTTQLDPIA